MGLIGSLFLLANGIIAKMTIIVVSIVIITGLSESAISVLTDLWVGFFIVSIWIPYLWYIKWSLLQSGQGQTSSIEESSDTAD